MIALLLNPRVIGGLALLAAAAWTHWQAYQAGAAAVRGQWAAQVQEIRDKAVREAQADAETTVKVVTEYVDRDKIIYRDRDVIRDRIVRVCDESQANRAQLLDGSGDPDAPAAADPLDGIADDIPRCVAIRNQLEALQQFIRERW